MKYGHCQCPLVNIPHCTICRQWVQREYVYFQNRVVQFSALTFKNGWHRLKVVVSHPIFWVLASATDIFQLQVISNTIWEICGSSIIWILTLRQKCWTRYRYSIGAKCTSSIRKWEEIWAIIELLIFPFVEFIEILLKLKLVFWLLLIPLLERGLLEVDSVCTTSGS